MNARDRDEFNAFLHACTLAQVRGVFEKETNAGREDYAQLARTEAARRGIDLEDAS